MKCYPNEIICVLLQCVFTFLENYSDYEKAISVSWILHSNHRATLQVISVLVSVVCAAAVFYSVYKNRPSHLWSIMFMTVTSQCLTSHPYQLLLR